MLEFNRIVNSILPYQDYRGFERKSIFETVEFIEAQTNTPKGSTDTNRIHKMSSDYRVNFQIDVRGPDDDPPSPPELAAVYVAVRFDQLNIVTYVLGTYISMDAAVARLHAAAHPHALTKLDRNRREGDVYTHKERSSLLWVKTLPLGDTKDISVVINQP